ncbi:hypothetical protein V6N11_062937 [Hibiscus sabdariffa]|uniref:Cytochrome P450 n=1 Tax=Hibiscus sabdariffa TaxID=183260 RepID=A0ABR2NPQ4_9ROSI
MVKEIVKNHDVVFSNRPKTTATDILHYGTKDFGFAPYGEYWKQVKKISVLELFSIEESNRFSSSGTKKLGVIIDKIRGACRKGESVNLSDMFLFVSNNIVSRCVISRKIEEDGGTCSKMGLLARRSAVLLTSFCVGDMFPYLRMACSTWTLTEDNTKANLLDMFVAGTDTTASSGRMVDV